MAASCSKSPAGPLEVHAFPKVAEDVAEFAKAKYIDISSPGGSDLVTRVWDAHV